MLTLFSGCATTNDPYHGLDQNSRYYRVKEGDTMYGISRHVGRAFRQIAKWNRISPPYPIYVGQTIQLFPPPEPRRSARISKTRKTKIAALPIRPSRPRISDRKSEKFGVIQKTLKKKLKVFWKWPLKGVIAKNYSQTGRKGVDIAGKFGESVRAAADGRVVYCGQGLIGYGNLIIVKHNEHFLSAYGNNRRLLVHEGEFVKLGQRIAEVGLDTENRPMLHFEIREDGKPVDPIYHLSTP